MAKSIYSKEEKQQHRTNLTADKRSFNNWYHIWGVIHAPFLLLTFALYVNFIGFHSASSFTLCSDLHVLNKQRTEPFINFSKAFIERHKLTVQSRSHIKPKQIDMTKDYFLALETHT